MNFLKYSALGVMAVAAAAVGLNAPADAQFYKGKRVNIIINYSAGGNTDIQGRMVMRHMKKYIPGNPRLVFRHVSGAGGSVGANFLAEAGKKNGYMMGVFTIPIMGQVMKAPELRADLAAFHYVGAIGQQTISHIRKDAIPGKTIKNWKDLLNTDHKIRTGGHGPTSSKDLRTRLFFEALEIPLKHVTGYKSGGKIRAAILKNELDMTADSLAGYFGRVVGQLIKPGVSVPIWHVGTPGPNNTILHSPSVAKNIPSFQTVYEAKFGNAPNIGSAYGYQYMDLTAKALEIAGRDLTVDSFIKSLESIKDYKIPFGETILSFGPDKHLGSNESYLFMVKDGVFVQMDDKNYAY